jgi:hypothetical protein
VRDLDEDDHLPSAVYGCLSVLLTGLAVTVVIIVGAAWWLT